MAKKEDTPKTILERNYIIPLRQSTFKSPPHKKAKKAVSTVKIFIKRHMKSSEIKMGKYLNLEIWKHGMKNPPHKVKVTATKDDKGNVFVELEGAPKEKPKIEIKKPAKKEKKPESAKSEEKLEKQAEESKEEKAEEAKKIEKEEIKELKKEQKEHPHMAHAPKILPKPKMQEQHPTAPKSF